MDDDGVKVTDHPEAGRFEAYLNGDIAGVAYYRRQGERFVFTHTEVGGAYEGKGVGGALARFALDTVRSNGGRVVAQCPFVARFIKRHPEYQDLVDVGALGDI